MMIDPTTGGVHTAHTTNPVPFVAFGTRRAGVARWRIAARCRPNSPEPARTRIAGRDDWPGAHGDAMTVLRSLPIAVALSAAARSAGAQVGHEPGHSPYHDIHKGHYDHRDLRPHRRGGRAIRHRPTQRQFLRHPLRHQGRKRGTDGTRILSRESPAADRRSVRHARQADDGAGRSNGQLRRGQHPVESHRREVVATTGPVHRRVLRPGLPERNAGRYQRLRVRPQILPRTQHRDADLYHRPPAPPRGGPGHVLEDQVSAVLPAGADGGARARPTNRTR